MEKEIKESEGLRFLRTELEHFKNIDKKIIEIGGRSIVIVGGNGEGKSSLIQALTSGLDVKQRPSKPIKKGETHASISTTLGGLVNGVQKEYVLDLYFSPKNESGRLVITDISGEKVPNPAGFIKGLIGNVSFDVMEWLNYPKAKRLEKIKELTGISKELDVLNMGIKDKKVLKTKRKEKTEELEAILKNHKFTHEEIELYSQPIDLSVIQSEMSTISAKQEQFDGAVNKLKGFKDKVASIKEAKLACTEEVKRLQDLIKVQTDKYAALDLEINALHLNIEKGDEWLKVAVRPNSAEISNRLIEANQHNNNTAIVTGLANQSKEMIKAKEDVQTIDAEIKKLEGERSLKIKNSQLPIEGLTFDDDEVYLNDIPLEDGGVNTAGLMSTSIKMAIYQARKSNLKAIFINDSSLFDKNSLREAVEEIEANNLQAIIELVDFNGGELQVKFTEEILN